MNVPLIQKKVSEDYVLNPQSDEKNTYYKTILRSIHERTPLTDYYFSPKNVDRIQRLIKKKVYDQSGKKHLIDRQSDADLIIIMRYIYLTNLEELSGKYVGNDVGFIKILNSLTTEEAARIIIPNISAHFKYLETAFTNPIDMISRPKNVSSTGEKTLVGSANRFL